LPSQLSSGHIHLSYSTHPPPSWYNSFSLFRISCFPLCAIGIADFTGNIPPASLLAEFKETLSSAFPPASPFPFASKIFAFESGEDNTLNHSADGSPELIHIPSLMGNKQLYIGTLLAELCHDVLVEFPALVSYSISPFSFLFSR
jgi:trafficking protein particle complex subunit 9